MAQTDLNEILIFIKVAQLENFSRAAESLELPKSTVSTKITQLEKRLGVNLIHRTTRKLSLTQEGERFYSRCVENIQNLKNAEEEITFSKETPSGKIKISAPVFLGGHFLPDIIAQYNTLYPDVDVELVLTDRHVDLIGEGIDIAIRSGELEDSTFISKKIGVTNFSLYATKAYLKNRHKISHPKDLSEHRCLQFSYLGREKWTLNNSEQRQTVTVPMKCEVVIDDLYTIKQMVERDQGIAFLPEFSCIEDKKNKDLINVLPSWKTQVRPLHFIYPSSKFLPPKLKQFIALAEKMMKPFLG